MKSSGNGVFARTRIVQQVDTVGDRAATDDSNEAQMPVAEGDSLFDYPLRDVLRLLSVETVFH
jgi:hypothetical protein